MRKGVQAKPHLCTLPPSGLCYTGLRTNFSQQNYRWQDTSPHTLPLGVPTVPAPFRDQVRVHFGWPSHQLCQSSCLIQTREGSPCVQSLMAMVLLLPTSPNLITSPSIFLIPLLLPPTTPPLPSPPPLPLELSFHRSVP